MEIRRIPIDKINPASYNPRKDLKPGDPEYESLRRSIDEFGLVEPLVWNEVTGNLVGGHQRLKILLEHGVTEVEVSVVHLDLEHEKALNIALNKIQGEWDEQKLSELLAELVDEELTELTGFSEEEITKLFNLTSDVELNPYTPKAEAVQYEPKGDARLEELVDTAKYDELLEKINKSECREEVKEFLRLAATRFLRFNYAKIADYYAAADEKTQELFEDLALVIIDFDDAVARGFVRFSKLIEDLYSEEYG